MAPLGIALNVAAAALRPGASRPLSGQPLVWNDKRTPPGQYSTVDGGQPSDIDGRPVPPPAGRAW